MPPLEAWQKVFVDNEKFVNQDPHAKVTTCIQCHGGVSGTDDMVKAHEGVVTDPSADAEMVAQKCGTCHADIAKAQVTSLHYDSHGYDTIVGQRLGDAPESHKAWEQAQANHCSSCHTTCGQCHVSQPTSVGGGLISGHQLRRPRPSPAPAPAVTARVSTVSTRGKTKAFPLTCTGPRRACPVSSATAGPSCTA